MEDKTEAKDAFPHHQVQLKSQHLQDSWFVLLAYLNQIFDQAWLEVPLVFDYYKIFLSKVTNCTEELDVAQEFQSPAGRRNEQK